MLKISRNTILQYIPNEFETEEIVNPKRIYEYNKKNSTGEKVIYLCERELRAKDNFALQFAKSKSEELNIPLKIIYPKTNYEYKPKQKFIHRQIEITKSAYLKSNIDFEIIENDLLKQLKMLNPAILILDFNPILNRDWIKYLNCKIYEIDSHNILPTRYASEEKEYSAATFRRKIYYGIYPFLTNYSNFIEYQSEADLVLEDFIQNKLERYAEDRNNPNKNVLSNLSKYLNLGFISSETSTSSVSILELSSYVFLSTFCSTVIPF